VDTLTKCASGALFCSRSISEPFRSGLSRRVVLRIPHFAAAAVVVSKTDLVVTLPARMAREVAEELKLVTLPVPFALKGFTFSIGYSSGFENDPAHRWFRARLVEAAQLPHQSSRLVGDEPSSSLVKAASRYRPQA
jgi:DNA-binding transcriptional LysR family regulator